MTSLDLFAGAGGITLGFKKAGIKSIGAIEIDRFAAETFRYNFPDIPLYNRDIYSFSDEEIRERFSGVDIIAGGPPCQGFSVAGPSQYGIIDQRNTLIMEFFRFIKVLRPKICVLENVKGILSGKMNSSQKALNTYLDALEVIGYTTDIDEVYILCRAKNSDRERRKQNAEPPFDIDAALIIDLYERVERHLNAIWWKPDDAVEMGKIINRPN